MSRLGGVSNYNQLVGDYHNPILKPGAVAVVQEHGALSREEVMPRRMAMGPHHRGPGWGPGGDRRGPPPAAAPQAEPPKSN